MWAANAPGPGNMTVALMGNSRAFWLTSEKCMLQTGMENGKPDTKSS